MGNAEQQTNDSNESFLDELAPGTELLQGQYKIDRFLNSGGFGITYLASDSLERKVVIKECFPSSFCNRSRAIVQARSRAHTAELRSVVQLFVQEARSLAKLNHPNIVGVHQVFEDNETAYMVLDFVEGRDLLDTLEDGDHGLTGPQIKGILKDVLSAVQFIHDQDILHRDISPDNILLDADMRPVLIDFGAAREEATKKSRVLSAMRVVKDGYSPQEFYIQGSEQTPASDLYALGATFYHLIAGEIPPNSQARLAAIASGEDDPYEPLAGRIKGFDSKFLSALDKSLGILPKDRMQSADDWLAAMEGNRRKSRVLTQPVPMSSAAAASQVPEKRSSLVPLLGSVAVVALLAVGGLAFTGNLTSSDDEVPATDSAETTDDTTGTAPVEDATDVAAAPAADAPTLVLPEAEAPSDTSVSDLFLPGLNEPAAGDAETADAVTADGAPTADTTDPLPSGEATFEFADVAPALPGPADEAAAPENLAEATEDTAPTLPSASNDLEAPSVAEAPEDLEIDAPLPVIIGSPDAPSAPLQGPDAPAVIAEITPTLRPQARPDFAALAAPGQDDIASVEIAEQDIAAPAPVEPEVVAPVEAPQIVAEAPTEAAPAEDDSILTSQLRFDLPFFGDEGSNVITGAAIVAPIWARPGTEILAVNGIEIDQIADIEGIVADMVTEEDADVTQVAFTIKAEGEQFASVQPWVMGVKHETALPDGTTFVTSMVNDAWQTRVTAISSSANELQVGDVVVAFVATSEAITDHVTFRGILERELAIGTNQFNFAVTREGSMWVVAMTYAEGA